MKHMNIGWRFAIFIAVMLLFASGHAAAAMLVAPLGAADLEELAGNMAAANASFKSAHKEVKEGYAELTTKMGEQGTKITQELKDQIDKVISDFNTKFEGMKGEMTTLEQKAVAARDKHEPAVKSWGEQFIDAPSFKSVAEAASGGSFQGSVRAEIKQVNTAAAGGLITSTFRDNELVTLLRERRVVRDLLNSIRVNTNAVDYVTQTTRTNNAAPVAESASKPYSDYAWGSATANIRVLAHLAKITRQAMEDAPRLVGEIDAEMRYGLGFVEERQFLFGNNTGQNLHGIMPQATAFAVPAGFSRRAGTTKIDVLRVAMLQNSVALLPADGIVLNDVDWADIELTKTTDGNYLFSNPQGTVTPRMWSLPVVTTPAMTADNFLVGNFTMGATIYDRMSVELLISTENADDFETNRATMRCEERVGLAVKRPQAFTKGLFTTAIIAVNPA
jgi:HK97 family phage major capsid protein